MKYSLWRLEAGHNRQRTSTVEKEAEHGLWIVKIIIMIKLDMSRFFIKSKLLKRIPKMPFCWNVIHVLQISTNICKFDIDLPPRSTSLCAVIKFTGGAGSLQGKIKRLQGFPFSHKNRLLPSLTHRCERWLQIQLYVNVNVPASWNKLEQNETWKQIQNVKFGHKASNSHQHLRMENIYIELCI